jgi:hypothetical protein
LDAAALGQAAARCLEMLEEFPTTLAEDEVRRRLPELIPPNLTPQSLEK